MLFCSLVLYTFCSFVLWTFCSVVLLVFFLLFFFSICPVVLAICPFSFGLSALLTLSSIYHFALMYFCLLSFWMLSFCPVLLLSSCLFVLLSRKSKYVYPCPDLHRVCYKLSYWKVCYQHWLYCSNLLVINSRLDVLGELCEGVRSSLATHPAHLNWLQKHI